MPTVPRYDQVQLEERQIPTIRANDNAPLEAFGGGAGLNKLTDATRNFAETGIDIFEAEKKKADEANIRDADIASSSVYNKIKLGLKNYKGKDSVNSIDYIDQEWSKESQAIIDNLKNDVQKEAASRILSQRKIDLDYTAQTHMASELERYNDETHKVALDTYRSDGSMEYNRPGAIQKSIYQQEQEIDRYAASKKGLPEGWAENQKSIARSKTYRDVLERMWLDGLDNDAIMKKAEVYEKQVEKFIRTEDADILARFRKDAKERKSLKDQKLERDMYLYFMDSNASTDDKLDILNLTFRNNPSMSVPLMERARRWILDEYDNKEIPYEEKQRVFNDLLDGLKQLGAKFEDGQLVEAPSGNAGDVIREFRQTVADNKRYLRPSQYKFFIDLTQEDFDANRKRKQTIFDNINSHIQRMGLDPVTEKDVVDSALSIFNRDITIEQSLELASKIKKVASLRYRITHPIGQITKNQNGVWLKVIGYNEDNGMPILDTVE